MPWGIGNYNLNKALNELGQDKKKRIGGQMTKLNRYIDHTLLKPDCTKEEIQKLCNEAVEHQFYAVCVPPYYISAALDITHYAGVKIASVIGFPLGYELTDPKFVEAGQVLDHGADEVDMVMNIAAFKSGKFSYVKDEIQRIFETVKDKDGVLKVIIETALLTDDEIKRACEICAERGVDFVKTSTGFSHHGAKIEHVKLMREFLPRNIMIKAAGGIKTKEMALVLIEAGADRLGCSASLKIMEVE